MKCESLCYLNMLDNANVGSGTFVLLARSPEPSIPVFSIVMTQLTEVSRSLPCSFSGSPVCQDAIMLKRSQSLEMLIGLVILMHRLGAAPLAALGE